MHRVASAGNTSNSSRPRKEKRLTYVLNDADNTKHCAGVNCLAVLNHSEADNCSYLFTGSRDGTLKRWALGEEDATCSSTFESHVDWVNDAVLVGGNTLVSCSSDTTVKIWDGFSDGKCTRTLHQHTDYVTCLAASQKNSNIVASGGLGGEVFIWDVEAALTPVTKISETTAVSDSSNGSTEKSTPVTSLRAVSSSNGITSLTNQSQSQHEGYVPIAAKGHKESVYALAMNDTGTLLVSGGTEKAVRVWDSRSGQKVMKLRGHTDNIRALLLDSTGRFCLSGSSDSMIRLWDLGQQRCVHSYAVHTDSVWALATTPTFSHVYSGGRDLSLYLTDLSTRESLLVCTKEHPIQQLALDDKNDGIWVATTDSCVDRWRSEHKNPERLFQRGGSFLAGNLSFSRARASLEGSTPVPVYKAPTLTIDGIPGIVQHEILNNRRHVLTKDNSGSVKLWEITKGVVIQDYGQVSFEEKKEELFEMVSIPAWFTADTRLGSLSIHLDTPVPVYKAPTLTIDGIPGIVQHEILNNRRHVLTKDNSGSVKLWEITKGVVIQDYGQVSFEEKKEELFEMVSIPAWFTADTRLGSLSIHLDTPQCFSAEMYSADLNITQKAEDDKINLGRETLKGLLAHYLSKKKHRFVSHPPINGDHSTSTKDISTKTTITLSKPEAESNPQSDSRVYPPFQFHSTSPPSVITEGSQNGPWRKKITDLNGSEEDDFPRWVLDAVLLNRMPPREHTKCSFYLHPFEGSSAQILTQGKLSAPRILRMHKVVNYVVEKMVLDKSSDTLISDGTLKPWKLKPSIEILCNNQVLPPEMSLATVRAYIWKKPEDVVLNYRIVSGK